MNSGIHPSLGLEANSKEGANVGALLRAARIRRGDDLHQISKFLRIRYSYLEAIENGRFEDLPGSIYSTGFIRTYSEYLDLDAEEIIRRLKSDGTVVVKNTKLVFPAIIPEDGIPGSAIVVIGLVIAVIGYFTWYWSSSSDMFVADTVPTIPKELVTPTKPSLAESKVGAKGSLVEASSAVAAPAELSKKANPDIEKSEDILTYAEPTFNKRQIGIQKIKAPVAPNKLSGETTSEEPSRPTERESSVETTGQMRIAKLGKQTKKFSRMSPLESQKTPKDLVVGRKFPPKMNSDIDVFQDFQISKRSPDLETNVLKNKIVTSSLPAKPDPIQAAFDDNVPDTLSSLPDRKAIEVAAVPKPAQKFGQVEKTEPPAIPNNLKIQKNSRITLIAKYTSWIQLRDIKDNQIIFSKVLLKGQTYKVPDRKGLSLMTGNAGALEITVDGKAVPKIGKLGEVRRKVLLEANSLISGHAAIE